ncbi:MAG: type II secretion system protein GspM, partial [Candidatus Rokuibacteriota bacterium]
INTLAGRFLTAATPAVAASELQKIVKDTAAQVNTEVRSERILPTVDRGEILEVPIEITVSGEIRQLVDLLARLETAPKLMTIQDLKLRVVNVSQPKDILATVTLSGYILTGRS